MLPLGFGISGMVFPGTELVWMSEGRVLHVHRRRDDATVLAQWADDNRFHVQAVDADGALVHREDLHAKLGEQSVRGLAIPAVVAAPPQLKQQLEPPLRPAPAPAAPAQLEQAPASPAVMLSVAPQIQPAPAPPALPPPVKAAVTQPALPKLPAGPAPRCSFRKGAGAADCRVQLTAFLSTPREQSSWIFLGELTKMQAICGCL